MALGVRGFNPIWLLDDLEANLFDDNFYMYVLENVLPYIPSPVYHDPDLMIPWTNPIQFLANGTLPVDIFWDPDKVYRLEFRQNLGVLPPSQNDPLIYEVNDYMPGNGGGTPIDTVATASSNQITNPQFALISFAAPYTFSSSNPDPVEIAPGWFLELGGTGNATVDRIALNSTIPTPSNAPYALKLTLSGWNLGEVFLRQRFQQNGVLWANKIVSNAVTALLDGIPQSISATLVDSNGNTLAEVLTATTVTEEWTEALGYGELGASTNPNTPPAAYIDYKLALPNNVSSIYLTSFQLVVQDLPFEPSFEQDSIDRQLDHTFHYYKDSLLREQKESILTGWDFGLNPWQYYPVGTTNLATFGYTADQTIVIQQAYVASATGNNISTARGSVAQNYGFLVTSVTANNQFALVQYLDPATIRSGWGKIFSAMVKLNAQFQSGSLTYRMKMKLIYRSSLPPTLAQAEPIATWSASGEPVFSGGWTSVSANNDPVYLVSNGANTLTFEGFQLPAADNANMTLGIVIYSMNSMSQTGTPDAILFDRISLVQNEFAIDAPSLTPDETLDRCQYYYETTFAPGGATLTTGPQRVTILNALYEPQNPYFNAGGSPPNVSAIANGFGHQYQTIKRASPTLTIYSGGSTTAAMVGVVLNASSGVSGPTNVNLNTFYTAFGSADVKAFAFRGTTLTTMVTAINSSTAGSTGILYHYTADARLGL